MSHHNKHSNGRSKRHAIRVDRPPDQKVLYVNDENDWKLMLSLPPGYLKCPVPECPADFGRPRVSSKGLRYLQLMPQNHACTHGFTSGSSRGGGPPSERHLWYQERLARICNSLGYDTILEHWQTQADVYVPAQALALEVQLHPTDFEKRTHVRQTKNSQPVWFIPPSNNSRSVRKALFQQPAVRIEVYDENFPQTWIEPWNDMSLNAAARLRVLGTVAHLDRRQQQLYTGRYDALAFLKELLAGIRHWYPPGTPGLPNPSGGAWVIDDDLKRVQARMPVTHRPGTAQKKTKRNHHNSALASRSRSAGSTKPGPPLAQSTERVAPRQAPAERFEEGTAMSQPEPLPQKPDDAQPSGLHKERGNNSPSRPNPFTNAVSPASKRRRTTHWWKRLLNTIRRS